MQNNVCCAVSRLLREPLGASSDTAGSESLPALLHHCITKAKGVAANNNNNTTSARRTGLYDEPREGTKQRMWLVNVFKWNYFVLWLWVQKGPCGRRTWYKRASSIFTLCNIQCRTTQKCQKLQLPAWSLDAKWTVTVPINVHFKGLKTWSLQSISLFMTFSKGLCDIQYVLSSEWTLCRCP